MTDVEESDLASHKLKLKLKKVLFDPNTLQFCMTYINYLIIIDMGQEDFIKATSCRWHESHADELTLYLHAFDIYNTSISAALVEYTHKVYLGSDNCSFSIAQLYIWK